MTTPMVVPAADLDTSPPEWAIARMLARGSTGFLYGPPYCGKTLVTVEIALGLVNGSDVFGRKVIKGSVAACLGEGVTDFGCRVEARVRRQAADDAGTPGAPPYGSDGLYVIPEAFALPVTRAGEVTKSMAEVIAQLADIGDLELIIIDPVGRFLRGAALSHESSATRVMDGISALAARTGAAVLAINHPLKTSGEMRGAGPLTAFADYVLKAEPETGGQGSCLLTCEKQKFGTPFSPLSYVSEPFSWDEPRRDADGEVIPGETDRVETATIRLRDATAPGTRKGTAPAMARARRTGIRPQLHAVPDPAAAPGQRPLTALAADADARRELVRVLITPRCPVCSRPGGMSCDARMGPPALTIGRTLSGPMHLHQDRLLDAALSQPDPEGFLDAALAVLALAV